VLARRQERERKKKVQELEKANSFVPFELREVIPDPEKDTTNADIELQLREALISTQQCEQYDASTAALDPALQDDFISFEGLDGMDELAWDTPWNVQCNTLSKQAWDSEKRWNHESIDPDDAINTGLF
jgi:hypothetical protein